MDQNGGSAVTIYIKIPAGVVLKHGSHNQKDHAGKGATSVSPEVAASVLDRVRENGGLSVNMLDGSEPTSGYMVAKGGTKGAILDADEFYDPVKGPAALSAFVKQYRSDLGTGKSYLGLWHNTEDGKVYLDVSDNIMDRSRAVSAGRRRNQISIWDVANFAEISTGGTGELNKGARYGQVERHSDSRGSGQDDGRADRRVGEVGVAEDGGSTQRVVKSVVVRIPLEKHLQGKHNQKSHARGTGSGYEAWGDRAGDIEAMAKVGPSEDELRGAIEATEATREAWDVSDQEIEAYIAQDPDMQAQIDDRLDMAAEAYRQDTIAQGYDEDYEHFWDDFDQQFVRDQAVDDLRDEAHTRLVDAKYERADAAVSNIQNLGEVYEMEHSGTTMSGRSVKLETRTTYVEADEARVKVSGEIRDKDTGMLVGEYKRGFFKDEYGNMVVEHEILQFWDSDEYGGSGFAKAFNKRAEDFYISHGINQVYVHAALTEGGYAWAKQGFDFRKDYNGANGAANIRGRIDTWNQRYAQTVPSPVRERINDIADRMDRYAMVDPRYPTPHEIAMAGYVQGATSWPGKVIMQGANWYGVKSLTPSGRRKSTVEQELEAAATRVSDNQLKFNFKGKVDGDGDGRVGAAELRDNLAPTRRPAAPSSRMAQINDRRMAGIQANRDRQTDQTS